MENSTCVSQMHEEQASHPRELGGPACINAEPWRSGHTNLPNPGRKASQGSEDVFKVMGQEGL